MRRIFPAALLLLCLATPLLATEPAVDSHRAAAEACVQALGGEKMMHDGAATMLHLILQQNPGLEPYREAMQSWIDGVLDWSVIGPKYAEIYMEAFTEAELRELAAHYGSPLGQKYVAVVPSLMMKAGEFCNTLVAEHSAELEEVILKRTLEMEQQAEAGEGAASGTVQDGD